MGVEEEIKEDGGCRRDKGGWGLKKKAGKMLLFFFLKILNAN